MLRRWKKDDWQTALTWGTIQRDWSKITPILRALGEQDTVSLHISTEYSGGRVDRKRILRELRTCPYLISGCWKASMRPCPEHSLPIWHYSDSYQKHIRNRRCGTSISIFSQPHYRDYLNSPPKIGSWGVFKSIPRKSLKIKLSSRSPSPTPIQSLGRCYFSCHFLYILDSRRHQSVNLSY